MDSAFAVRYLTARFRPESSDFKDKQAVNSRDNSASVTCASFTKDRLTVSGKAIILAAPMQRMPMMTFSALLIITLNAWFGTNAAGTPTMAVVYPDRNHA